MSVLPDFSLGQSTPDTASYNLIPPVRGSAVGQNHYQEPDLPNIMAKPVDKVRQIRYNFLWYFNLFVITCYTTDSRFFGACFSIFRHKNEAIAPVDLSIFATAPSSFYAIESRQ